MADDSEYSAFPSEDEDPTKMLAGVLSPASAQSLVPSPPDLAPRTGAAVTTPQTGSLATAPQQATPKNLDTAAGRQSYNVQPAQPVQSPTGAAQPAQSTQPVQQASAVQPLRPAGVQPAGTTQPQLATTRPQMAAAQPLRPAMGSTNGVVPAQGIQPAQAASNPQMARDQAIRDALVNSRPGWQNIKNPVGKVAAGVGNAALSFFLPTVAPFVPGTTANYQQRLGVANQNLGQDQAQAQQAAATADTQSQADERRAKIAQDIANAGKADRFDPNAAKTVDTGDGVFQLNPDTGKYDIRIGASAKAGPEGEKPLGSTIPNLNKTLSDRYQVLNPGKQAPPQYQLPPNATQKDYDRVDKALAGVEGAQGTLAQRQTSNALRQQAMAATEAARSAAGNAGLDRETTRMAKPYETANSAASTQLDKIDDARAMVNGNAEAQALGIPKVLTALVGGQGTGVRITTPELNAIARARGWAGDFQGTLNSISGKGKLTSTQQQQLTKILDDVKARITQKRQIANDALDKINGASGREDVIAADKEARQRLTDLESGKVAGGGAKPAGGGFNWDAHPKVNP